MNKIGVASFFMLILCLISFRVGYAQQIKEPKLKFLESRIINVDSILESLWKTPKVQQKTFGVLFLPYLMTVYLRTLSSLPILVKAATALSSCFFEWPAETWTRILARSLGTTG